MSHNTLRAKTLTQHLLSVITVSQDTYNPGQLSYGLFESFSTKLCLNRINIVCVTGKQGRKVHRAKKKPLSAYFLLVTANCNITVKLSAIS